jgi:hypothetical protein
MDMYESNTISVPERPIVFLGSLDVSASWPSTFFYQSTQNGLGVVNLGIPNNYVVSKSDFVNGVYDSFPVNILSLEFMYYTSFPPSSLSHSVEPSGDTVYKLDDATGPGDLRHCSLSVFTSTPASIISPFNKCCVEMTASQKLSIAYAFAGLAATAAVVATTMLFCCWASTLTDDNELKLNESDISFGDINLDESYSNGETRSSRISKANSNESGKLGPFHIGTKV